MSYIPLGCFGAACPKGFTPVISLIRKVLQPFYIPGIRRNRPEHGCRRGSKMEATPAQAGDDADAARRQRLRRRSTPPYR